MIIDVTSFFFNSKIEGATATPAWGTSIGQSKSKECRIETSKDGVTELLTGMIYKSKSDRENFDLSKGSQNREYLIYSIFDKVFINDTLIKGKSFILLLSRENSKSHLGRLNISYPPYASYTNNEINILNEDTINEMRKRIGCEEMGCWFGFDISVKNQDELHFSGIVVDPVQPMLYTCTSAQRSAEWNALIECREKNIKNSQDSRALQQIYYGAPGTGKSYTINAITNQERANTIRTTFHPDTDYSSFVGAYKPTTIEESMMTVIGTKAVPVENTDGTPRIESKIVYEFVSQSFLKAYVNAWKLYAMANDANNVEKQFLVIEEINRGNCAQIFGDLFQLLDRNDSGFSDYPIDADADMQKQLCKQFRGLEIPLHSDINKLYEDTGRNIVSEVLQGKILLLPNNFYIWATMNTSDQSLFPIDSAFKRRWDWEYMPISNAEKNWIISVNGNNYDWWEFLQAINELIGATTYSEDKKLGYFFCKAHEGVISAEKFVGKVIFYLWNDVFKDYGFEGEAFTDTDEGGKLTFEKFYKVIHGRETAINENILEMFLKNLKLKPLNKDSDDREDMEDGEIANLSEKDSKSFSLNGKKMNLKDIAKKVVSNYCSLHQEEDAQSIRDLFINKCKGIGISHIVETEQEFALRSDQKSAQRTVNEIKLSNGEKLYVSTQWRAGNPEDNFYKFIKIVHNNNWGKIELVD